MCRYINIGNITGKMYSFAFTQVTTFQLLVNRDEFSKADGVNVYYLNLMVLLCPEYFSK